MGINLENLFIQSADSAAIADIVQSRLDGSVAVSQPDWPLPSSFPSIIAKDLKRKLVISLPDSSWVLVVESNEYVDHGMAREISERLSCKVVIIVVSEVTGSAGYLVCEGGKLIEHRFEEDSQDPIGLVDKKLRSLGIPFHPFTFSHAIARTRNGWISRAIKKAGSA